MQMTTIGLDDTLHAVVRVTHDHGLPLDGATVYAARAQVHTTPADLRWWVRWLTDPAADEGRYVVWEKDATAAFYVSAIREGVEWTVVEQVPTALAVDVLAGHDLTVSATHLAVPAAAAVALADALADHERES
jgi:hypothetical protein